MGRVVYNTKNLERELGKFARGAWARDLGQPKVSQILLNYLWKLYLLRVIVLEFALISAFSLSVLFVFPARAPLLLAAKVVRAGLALLRVLEARRGSGDSKSPSVIVI